MKFEIEGLDELEIRFGAYMALRVAATSAQVAQTTNAIFEDAVAGAPVDTGELVSSAYQETEGTSGEVGFTAEHAIYPEFGTSKQKANPYLGPAVEKNRNDYMEGIKKAMQ